MHRYLFYCALICCLLQISYAQTKSKNHSPEVEFFYLTSYQFHSFLVKLQICSDDYKINNYVLQCKDQLSIKVIEAYEIFNRQGVLPECSSDGYNYNFSRPFVQYCDGKPTCAISSAFLDDNKLFSGETYFLPDPALYLIPFRIDVTYMCLSKLSF
jgi:hypothetical protein